MVEYSNLLLYSLFPEKDRWKAMLILMVYPYILGYFERLWKRFTTRSTFSLSFSEKFGTDGKLVACNPTYTALSWYCGDKYPNKVLKCGTYSTIKEKFGSAYVYRYRPVYEPTSSLSIEYREVKIEVHFDENEKKRTIVLTSEKNCDFLKEFVNEVVAQYETKFLEIPNPEKCYVYSWKGKNPSDYDFSHAEMKINKTFKNVYLPGKLEKEIRSDLEKFLSNESFYHENGIPYKRGYLLHGVPGGGKNSTIYAIAREYKMNIYKLGGSTDKVNLRDMVSKIPPRSILFLDELDMLIYNDREVTKEKEASKETTEIGEVTTEKDQKKIERPSNVPIKDTSKIPMSTLMEILDGYDYLHGCLVITTTNHKENLDPALIRPGRIDLHFHIDLMNSGDIIETVRMFSGHNISIPDNIRMSSSQLLNSILIPHREDRQKILELIMLSKSQ